uniref:Uncharacterized protein n=1 Tax=Globisporangium ultimum (strain ATCC 200006 / CBS 805.95 / DAOM BR144) TaxID=431595 RepID=K3WW10_GLOUD
MADRSRQSSRASKKSSRRKSHSRHSESERNSESEEEEDPTSPVKKRVRNKEKSKESSSKTKKRASGWRKKESGVESEHDDAEQQTKTKKTREQVVEERERARQQKAEQREVTLKERERLKQQKAELREVALKERERIKKEKAEIREMAIKTQEHVRQEKAELRAKKLEAAAMKDNGKEKAHGGEKDAVTKKHRKVPKKPVSSSDSEKHSSSSESDGHESPVKKVKKVRKQEITSKEHNGVVFAGIDAVKDKRTVKRSKVSTAAHAGERHDDGSSRSRKRPLAGSKAVKDGKLVFNEASADIRDRPHSAKGKPREHEPDNHDEVVAAAKSSAAQQEESAPTSSIPNDKSHRKEDGVVKASRKRVISQEEEDWRLAIALSSRKSERAQKRAHSSDSMASVGPVAQAEERVAKKRKREVKTEASNDAATEGFDVEKPEKPKSRTLKKSSASALNSAASTVAPSSAEKVMPTKKVRQKLSADASPPPAADPVKAETKRTLVSPKERRSDRAEHHHRHKEGGERKSVGSKVCSQNENDQVLVKKSRKKSMESGGVEESAKEHQKADEVDAASVDPAEGKDDAMPANKPRKSPKETLPQIVDAKTSEQLVQVESASLGTVTHLIKLEVKEESVDQVPKSPPAVVKPDTIMADSVDQKKPESGEDSTVASSPKPTAPLPAQEEKPVGEREEGEEEEEGVVADSHPGPKQEAKPDDAKPESKANAEKEDPTETTK